MFFKNRKRKKLIALFAAHAPEPPQFFAIEPTAEAPRLPELSTIKDEAERAKAAAWIESQGVARPENPSEDLRGFMASYERVIGMLAEWQQHQQEQRYFDWKRGYALKMAAIFEGII